MKKANLGHVLLWQGLRGEQCTVCGIDFDPLDIMEDIAYDNGYWMHKTCLEQIESVLGRGDEPKVSMVAQNLKGE